MFCFQKKKIEFQIYGTRNSDWPKPTIRAKYDLSPGVSVFALLCTFPARRVCPWHEIVDLVTGVQSLRAVTVSLLHWFSGASCEMVACVADSCKHPCTQSVQPLQFACSNFPENKKPFLIGYFGLVWYAPFDWPKIMITLQSRAYNKNKCTLISRSDGGGQPIDLVFHYPRWLFLFNSMSDSPFYCNACSVHLEKSTDKNLVEMGTKVYKKTH